MIRESHSLVPPDPKLDKFERLGLILLGIGIAMLFGSLFNLYDGSFKTQTFWGVLALIFAGGLTYGLRTHLKRGKGIQNNNITRASISSRGGLGWTVGIIFTTWYVVYYWRPDKLTGLTSFFNPLSEFMRGGPADQWFVYGSFYTIAVLIMGTKAIVKYRHSRYQIIRTSSIVFFQLVFAYTIPYWMSAMYNIEYYPSYFWPLQYGALFPDGEIASLLTLKENHQQLAIFLLGWSILSTIIVTPFLTYKLGKRWYCSWVCGCGGLANTAGDAWRQLSDKSTKAWKIERITIYSVLVFIIITTASLWLHAEWKVFGENSQFAGKLAKVYGFLIGSIMSGVVGTGFYPLLGTRIWCRFACPMAAILGIVQRFKSRFRITTNGAQCISCGNCSKYCEMGIDVRWYAQRGQDIVRASCVGCGMCSAVCPRGVLNLENGPVGQRAEYEMDLIGSMKARQLEKK